jgi:hypothetical protein
MNVLMTEQKLWSRFILQTQWNLSQLLFFVVQQSALISVYKWMLQHSI